VLSLDLTHYEGVFFVGDDVDLIDVAALVAFDDCHFCVDVGAVDGQSHSFVLWHVLFGYVHSVDSILTNAIRSQTNDVHIKQQKQSIQMHYRIDNLLRDIISLPKSTNQGLTTHIKIIDGMDITKQHVPQNKRMRLTVDDLDVGGQSLVGRLW